MVGKVYKGSLLTYHMNKQQKIKRLTWKYFWQQKVEEMIDHLPSIIAISFALSVGLIIFGVGMSDGTGIDSYLWFSHIGISIMIFWALIGISYALKYMIIWLKDNWKEAKRRAEKDIKNE